MWRVDNVNVIDSLADINKKIKDEQQKETQDTEKLVRLEQEKIYRAMQLSLFKNNRFRNPF